MNSCPIMRNGALAAIVTLALTSCSYPRFEARREVDIAAPAAGVKSLACASHNGDLELVGHAGATEFRAHAVITARGDTQAAADSNVARLEVEFVRDGDRLVLMGVKPEDMASNVSPSFAFKVSGPARLVTELETHNGSVTLQGLLGDTSITTHNGNLSASVDAGKVMLETHNGSVSLELAGTGPVSGDITSHNGTIQLGLGARSATVDASTHNGSVKTDRADAKSSGGSKSRRIVVGEGGGTLSVVTHNGTVIVR